MSREIFEKNLKAMEKWYAPFAEALREESLKSGEEEITIEQSWDGELIFRVKKEGKNLYLGGKRNAKEPVQMWMERLGELPEQTPVFLFGLGSGAYLKELVRNTNEKVNIVAYEPSAKLFITMLEHVDISEEIENRPIAFLVEGVNAEGFKTITNQVLVLENLQMLKEEIHPNYIELYGEHILPHLKGLEKKVSMVFVNYRTGRKMAVRIALNLLKNMPYVCEGYNTRSLIKVLPTDRAAVMVAAGPSLNKNIHELKRAKNKLFILAVDTAVKPLMKAGIAPDAFITMDALKPLSLIEIEGSEELPIIAPACAVYEVIEHQKGKKLFYFDGREVPQEVYKRNGMFLPPVAYGGSVSCPALSLLYMVGFETVIMVGQDLAYTNNRSHADGTFQDKMEEQNTEHMQKVKGNYEDEVPVRPDFIIYKDWLEDYIQMAKKYDENFRVINATEGGAYIEGTEIMTLKEALDENCQGVEEVDFAARIREMPSDFDETQKEKALAYVKEIPGLYETILKDVKELKQTYVKLKKLVKKDNPDQKACLKLLKKIKKLTKKFEQSIEYDLLLSMMSRADFIIQTEFYVEKEDDTEELRLIARQGILYCDLLMDGAEILKDIAEDVVANME
ncbi:MAG: motility associated factor glycosyltransferase family protein [Roseburia sp.]|nr:motility associated factor glycosyltransferase family protein [Roseburia sp.]